MTLFSYHKYNGFILIQEIYTRKYTACTKDEANRIADNNLQSDGISYANNLAQADRCDCPKNWSASVVSSDGSGKTINYTIQYNNPCGSEQSSRMTIGYKRTNGAWEYETRIVPIPSGSGTFSESTTTNYGISSGAYAYYEDGQGSGSC
jgi:hypothetical protein